MTRCSWLASSRRRPEAMDRRSSADQPRARGPLVALALVPAALAFGLGWLRAASQPASRRHSGAGHDATRALGALRRLLSRLDAGARRAAGLVLRPPGLPLAVARTPAASAGSSAAGWPPGWSSRRPGGGARQAARRLTRSARRRPGPGGRPPSPRPPSSAGKDGHLMPLIARASIDQVQAAADMVEIVGQYTELRKAGANYSGRCPFHEERTPSFSVNPAEKLYYCFGCGAGGNLFGFVQQKENLDFAAAVEYLADRYGIALEYEESSARGDAERRRRERLRAAARAGHALLRARAARRRRRRRRPASTSRGAAWTTTSAASSAWASACRAGTSCATRRGPGSSARRSCSTPGSSSPARAARPYDRFRGRIMFPLADDRGRTLGFGARTMGDEKPKYLNSPETPLYHKSEAVFGLARGQGCRGQGRPRLRRRGLHRRAGAGAGRRAQRGGQHGHGAHRAAAQAALPADQESLPLLRRRRRRDRRHEPRAHARPQDGIVAARGPHPRRSRPCRLRAFRRRRRRFSPACAPKRRRCYNSTFVWRSRLTTSTSPTEGHARLRNSRGSSPRPRRRSNATKSCATSRIACSCPPRACATCCPAAAAAAAPGAADAKDRRGRRQGRRRQGR